MEYYVVRAAKNIEESELTHHGILGMKWGVRRYQNEDGSLTPAGRRRYQHERKKNFEEHKKAVSDFYTKYLDKEDPETAIKTIINRSPIMKEIVDSPLFNDYVEALNKDREYRHKEFYDNPENQKIARERLITDLMKEHNMSREYVENNWDLNEDLDDYYFANIDKKADGLAKDAINKGRALQKYSDSLCEKYFDDNVPGFRYDPGVTAQQIARLKLKQH